MRAFRTASHHVQGPIVDLDRDAYTDITDSRLAPQRASPGGVIIHQASGLPAARGRGLAYDNRRGPYGGAVWVDTPGAFNIPADMFDADPDGTLTAATLQHQALGQVYQAITQVRDENRQLRAELKQDRQQAAAEAIARERAKKKAEINDALDAILRWRSADAGADVDAEDEEERPPSLLEQARLAREERRLEAEELNEERFQENLRRQKRRFPPDQYPELYAHLEPEPLAPRAVVRKPVAELLAPCADDPPSSEWQWPVAIAALVGFVAVTVLWPLRQGVVGSFELP